MNRTAVINKDTVISKKCIFLILDGLGDLPAPGLWGQTPLEAANTPVLNYLAGSGQYGLVDPTLPGHAPHTHTGSGSLMGLTAEQAGNLKRGPVEAAGAGVVLALGEVAIRANFASLSIHGGKLVVTDRRAGRISSGTGKMAKSLSEIDLGDGVIARLIPTNQHRSVLVLSGPGLDASITDTDPGGAELPSAIKICRALTPEAELTADKVNLYLLLAREVLATHPVNLERVKNGLASANGIITRSAGSYLDLDDTLHRRSIKTVVVSGCKTVLGLARMFGFKTETNVLFTATPQTDLDAKVATTVSALDDHDLVYMHVKAPDIYSHDRKPEGKRDFLQRLDAALKPLLASEAVIALAADHTTDSNSGLHTADPVPALIYDPASSQRAASTMNFGEEVCRQGNMTRQSGQDFFIRVIQSIQT